MDAKATVSVGEFSRGGKSRLRVAACDHDFKPTDRVTPVGIFLPKTDELFLYCVTSKVTADCLVDILEQWWQSVRTGFKGVTTLVLNLDNGPENHSRRTQFMARLLAFAVKYKVDIQLAYYPPYHSKYNPTQRVPDGAGASWNITAMVLYSTPYLV